MRSTLPYVRQHEVKSAAMRYETTLRSCSCRLLNDSYTDNYQNLLMVYLLYTVQGQQIAGLTMFYGETLAPVKSR